MATLLDILRQFPSDKIAITSSVRTPLTFGNLINQIEYLVETLNEHGIGKGDRVITALDNGPDTDVISTGLMAGMTAIPLDPKLPKDKHLEYLERRKPKAVIVSRDSQSEMVAAAKELKIPLIYSESDDQAGVFKLDVSNLPEEQTDNPGYNTDEDQRTPVLMLHTSGSSGFPKAAMHTLYNVITAARNIDDSMELAEGDVSLNVAPNYHVNGYLAGFLASTLNGKKVHCPEGFFKATEIFNWIAESGATWMTGTPTIYRFIANVAEGNAPGITVALRDHEEALALFKAFRTSSAPVEPALEKRLKAIFKNAVLETEADHAATFGMSEGPHQVLATKPSEANSAPTGTIGRRTKYGPEVRVTNIETGKPAKAGEKGELQYKGPAVFIGYHDQPDKTQESFTEDSWFKSGDLVHEDKDGWFFFHDRVDDVFKSGDVQVEPAGVDKRLMDHPEISEACVVPKQDPDRGNVPVAAVYLTEGSHLTAEDIVAYAKTKLARAEVPAFIYISSEPLPKTGNGKIQRKGVATEFAEELGLKTSPTGAKAPTPTQP